MNRRSFIKISSTGVLSFAIGSVATLDGCTVFDDILTWVPIGLTAIQGIVTVLGPLISPGALTILALIKAGFADLSAAVSEYNNDTNPADKANLLSKIRTILADIVSNFQAFLDALNLGDNPIINIVIGLANIVISAIEGFMNQLPSTKSTALTTRLSLGSKSITVTPKFYKSVKDFKKDYNSFALANNHGEIIIH